MSNTKEKKITQLLSQPYNQVESLVNKVNHLSALNELLHQALEPALAKHCCIANYRDQILVVEIESNAWATQFHYQSNDILLALQRIPEFRTIKKIDYYIKPNVMTKELPKRSLKLSPEMGELLLDTANHIEAPALRRALVRLARNAGKV